MHPLQITMWKPVVASLVGAGAIHGMRIGLFQDSGSTQALIFLSPAYLILFGGILWILRLDREDQFVFAAINRKFQTLMRGAAPRA
jgi:Na+-transporting NADH:ubiquinone oxidoreductase subunit NqrD